jgi:hypothetical protein
LTARRVEAARELLHPRVQSESMVAAEESN